MTHAIFCVVISNDWIAQRSIYRKRHTQTNPKKKNWKKKNSSNFHLPFDTQHSAPQTITHSGKQITLTNTHAHKRLYPASGECEKKNILTIPTKCNCTMPACMYEWWMWWNEMNIRTDSMESIEIYEILDVKSGWFQIEKSETFSGQNSIKSRERNTMNWFLVIRMHI